GVALSNEPFGEPHRFGLIPVDHRISQGPDRLLRGVGDHRLEVIPAQATPLARPEREPLELGPKTQRAWPEALEKEPGRRGLELEPELACLGDELLGNVALPGQIEAQDIPARALGCLCQASRCLAV